MNTEKLYIQADLPDHLPIIAGSSITNSPFFQDGFNIAKHVNDNEEKVENNRQKLSYNSKLTYKWLYLNQIHSKNVINDQQWRDGISADALICRSKQKVAVVMTADCLPILLCNKNADEVVAIHAGWRGLFENIIKETFNQLKDKAENFYAWIGPCAGKERYQVDLDFRNRFYNLDHNYGKFFKQDLKNSFLADLVSIAKMQLELCGVHKENIKGGNICSISDNKFFSYRRDGEKAGRTASFICIIK